MIILYRTQARIQLSSVQSFSLASRKKEVDYISFNKSLRYNFSKITEELPKWCCCVTLHLGWIKGWTRPRHFHNSTQNMGPERLSLRRIRVQRSRDTTTKFSFQTQKIFSRFLSDAHTNKWFILEDFFV